MSTSNLIGMMAAVIVASLAVPTSAQQQVPPPEPDDLPPFEESTMQADPPACPKELEAAVPGCALSTTFTTDGKYATCYCAGNGVVPVQRLPFPPGERNIARISALSVAKITKGGRPSPDPCVLMTIDGKKKYVCWNN